MAERFLIALCILAIAIVGTAGASNYMHEKTSTEGIGYKSAEVIISTQYGFNGAKLVEKETGSGNVLVDKTEYEAERQINVPCDVKSYHNGNNHDERVDYINFSKEAEFEYMPISYQTGQFNQKWEEKLCVQNYAIGGVLSEIYTHAEHLQKSTELKTKAYGIVYVSPEIVVPIGSKESITEESLFWAPPRISDGGTFDSQNPDYTSIIKITEKPKIGYVLYYATPNGLADELPPGLREVVLPSTSVVKLGYTVEAFSAPCCTGVLEANLNSNVIGVAHIGWISQDTKVNTKGRHNEYGRRIESMTGAFSIDKFIQLWGNSTCGAISVDWLPCT